MKNPFRQLQASKSIILVCFTKLPKTAVARVFSSSSFKQKIAILMPLTNEYCNLKTIEAVAQGFSVKKVFFEILQNSHENTCVSLFFNKVAGLSLQLY